jgi:hypothetical protein
MKRMRALASELDGLIFGPPRADWLYRGFVVLILAGLYLLGVVQWMELFNRGEIALSAFDWRQQRVYYAVMRDAIQGGQIPFFMTGELQTTNRFLGIPETSLLPHVLLLPFMTQQGFVLFETLFFYSLGFLGCALLMRRFRLSSVPFAILFFLFNFNGYITSHIAIGHVMWNAYFLLPFFVLLVFELIGEDTSILTALKLALVLAGVVFQGAFHIYTWCMLFLLILAAFNPSRGRVVKYALLALLFSALISAVRFVPAAVTFWGQERTFVSGYATLYDLFGALVDIRDWDYVSQFNPRTADLLYGAGWWEFDTFIGLVGLAVIVTFGVVLRFKSDPDLADTRHEALDAPLVALFVLSLNDFYRPVRSLPIPLLSGERVPARFLILPLLFLLVIACARIERLLPRLKGSAGVKVLALAAVAQMALALRRHLLVWQIAGIEAIFPAPEPVTATVLGFRFEALGAGDRLYVIGVVVSAVVSLVSLVVGIGLSVRAARRRGSTS